MPAEGITAHVECYFSVRGWAASAFQREAWSAFLAGSSGLLVSATGSGKTLAALLGPVMAFPDAVAHTVLWITPMRALAADLERSLRSTLAELNVPWSVGVRTGDTPAKERTRQSEQLPTLLVTTPESLSLLLTRTNHAALFKSLRAVVVDEWHELMGNKRGVQTQLALARLQQVCPGLTIWGLSATVADAREAAHYLLGPASSPALVYGPESRPIELITLRPSDIEVFPWAGHLGFSLLKQVVSELETSRTSLLFTNTRSQAEQWYQALLNERPDWAGQLALHHGSLDRELRRWVEEAAVDGSLRCVVCTSSLDLGVDFSPVETVFQIGSPKGVARLIQRAGRSGHQPGKPSRIICVPTHAFELIEASAAREAIRRKAIEPRSPPEAPVDVLVQHMATVALGGGFAGPELFKEVRRTWSYQALDEATWSWALRFITEGGSSLRSYDQFKKVDLVNGRYVMTRKRPAMWHRLSVGTIADDASVRVAYRRGGHLGSVEESFAARLRPGDCFVLGGKRLEVIRLTEACLQVKPAGSARKSAEIPRWMGGRMPLSTALADFVRARLDEAATGQFTDDEMLAVREVLEKQRELSCIPRGQELLIETSTSREGRHWFIYPFAGRAVHEGLSALMAYRISQMQPVTLTLSVNDYGFELLGPASLTLPESVLRPLLSRQRIQEDMRACLNATELSRRRFREIAQVAGLIFHGYPGRRKRTQQVQVSSSLLFEVFSRYEPDNLLLAQAGREALADAFEWSRLERTLQNMEASRWRVISTPVFSPLAFPLVVERIRNRVSSESIEDRVRRLKAQMLRTAAREEAGVTR